MKILFITPHLPASKTPQAGERLVYEVLKALSERHEIHLVVRLADGQEQGVDLLRAFCTSVHTVRYKRPATRGLLSLGGVVLTYYRLCRKAKRVAETGRFDCTQVEWTETGLFLRKKGRMVIDAHDVLAKPMERRWRNNAGLKRGIFHLLFLLTRTMERFIYRKFDTILVRSDYDKDYLARLAPQLDVKVLPHPAGLDISATVAKREENIVLFLAAMDRGPNVEAVLYFSEKILPLVRKQVPDVVFYIVGSRPLPEVRELAERDEKTIVTGFVEDIEPYYKTSTVFVAPLLTGGGVIVKILDALAAGIPVVTTSIGNEGICATPGEHLLIGDSPEDFARYVVLFLRDDALRRKTGGAGIAFVRSRFSLDALRNMLETMYPGETE